MNKCEKKLARSYIIIVILGTLLIIVGAMAIVFHKHERDYEKTFEARMLAAEKEGYKKHLNLFGKKKLIIKCLKNVLV